MKNREEYEASIFAKRDALLEKRKRITAAVTSALCITLCFVAAAVFLPKNLNKNSLETTSAATTSTIQSTVEDLVGMGGESGVFDAAGAIENELNEASAEDVERFTFNDTYTWLVTYPATKKQPASNKYFGYSPEGSSEKSTTAAAVATQTEIALETEIHWEDKCPEGTTKRINASTTVAATRNTEQLASTAYGYLTDEQKSKVLDRDTKNITVTRTSDGNEYYTVFFETEGGGYKVSLDGKTLELIEVKALASSTAKVSQGYNPNTTTAKPPMIPSTTAAPEYIPN